MSEIATVMFLFAVSAGAVTLSLAAAWWLRRYLPTQGAGINRTVGFVGAVAVLAAMLGEMGSAWLLNPWVASVICAVGIASVAGIAMGGNRARAAGTQQVGQSDESMRKAA